MNTARSTCSENRATLVSAEIASIQGRELDAERHYEEAIRSARENGFIQNEGLAHELAARFYADRGFTTTCNAYLQNARACYVRWGADGKVRQMDLKYPHLVPHPERLGSGPRLDTLIERLDLTTVVKLSQAVAGEIDINRLIKILMETVLEHAGAERGLLILPRGEEMWIEAEAITAKETVEIKRQKMISQVAKSSVRFDAHIPEPVAERLREIANIANLVAEFFAGDAQKVGLWFELANPILGNVSPRDMIRIGRYKRLLNFVVDAREAEAATPR